MSVLHRHGAGPAQERLDESSERRVASARLCRYVTDRRHASTDRDRYLPEDWTEMMSPDTASTP